MKIVTVPLHSIFKQCLYLKTLFKYIKNGGGRYSKSKVTVPLYLEV